MELIQGLAVEGVAQQALDTVDARGFLWDSAPVPMV